MTLSPRTGRQTPTGENGEDAASNSVEQACLLIRQDILSGHFGPGARIKVADLSSRFGFSAMPLREALRKLEGEGLVEIEPNRGATVRKLDRSFIEDLFELNAELQLLAIRRFLRVMTLDKLDELEARATAYAEAVAAGDRERGVRLNRDLHARMVEFGGNREALRMFLRGWELIGAFRLRYGYGPGRERGLVREHRLLLDALRRQDLQMAEAIIRMQQAAVLEDLFAQLGDDER